MRQKWYSLRFRFQPRLSCQRRTISIYKCRQVLSSFPPLPSYNIFTTLHYLVKSSKRNLIIPLVVLLFVWFDIRTRRNKFVHLSVHMPTLTSSWQQVRGCKKYRQQILMLISNEVVELFSLMLAKLLPRPTGWFILNADDGTEWWYIIYYWAIPYKYVISS